MDRAAGTGLSISPGFLLLAAGLYYIGGSVALTAFFTAVLAHELGHLSAMTLFGAELRKIRLTPVGLVIEYAGIVTGCQQGWIIAAGPAAGGVFALACFCAGTGYFWYAGAVALLATFFNLLPVYPLDGGRLSLLILCRIMPEETAVRFLRWTGSICAIGVTATGIGISSIPAAAAGVWMLLLAKRPDLR